ncbi:unnamed protein product [Gordionus sp. m RMFG-2023]
MKPGKVVLLLGGRYAGKKAIVVKNFDEPTQDKPHPHALVLGIEKYPKKITRRMGKKRIIRRNKIKPFIKIINYNHLLPTRYSVDLPISKNLVNKSSLNDPAMKKKALSDSKKKLEERYKTGKNKWFFTKLRF